MISLTIIEMILFAARSVLWPEHRVTESETVKSSVKNQENISVFIEIA